MDSPFLLHSDDFCRRQAHYLQRWEPAALTPKVILRKAIEHGLESRAEDPGEAASEEAMRLATEIGLDTAETDLLGLAEHVSGLASFLCWLLRSDSAPWKRPEPTRLPDGSTWSSGAFLSASERGLRSVALVDRWDAWREVELRNSWETQGETSAYQVPMDVIVVPIGSLRHGRWSNPFTVGWRHPVAKVLRFVKRDGESFGGAWERVQREKDDASREEWLDAMTEDGVLAENLHVLSADIPDHAPSRIALAGKHLTRIHSQKEPPEPHLSMCFDRIHPCPFRVACPRGLEPSEDLGFRAISPHA
jgi:hypothetical protein